MTDRNAPHPDDYDAGGWVSLGAAEPQASDALGAAGGDEGAVDEWVGGEAGQGGEVEAGELVWDEESERAALAAAAAEFGVDLDEDDLAEAGGRALPVVAIIGRPNVGKSTLVNRILGRREAVVQDVPGVTRDRVAYDAEWSGLRFVLLDTGGWVPDAVGMAARVAAQAERAVALADVVVLVVDAAVGATDAEESVVRVLRRSGKPVVLAANKVDDERHETDAAMLWSLGLGEPHAVSALHGRGSGDLLDAILDVLPEEGSGRARGLGPRRVALIGRPNVGKSSLLNKLAGQERAVVSEVAGTTVDPVDEMVRLRDREWLFVDTAGIRRRIREASGHEYYASLRTHAALEKAEVAVVLVDGGEPLSEQDLRIMSMVVEAGRALVLAVNKWDLVDEERRRYLEREIARDLAPVAWAPRVNVSARTGRAVDKLVPALDAALAGWETRVPTSRLNQFLKELVAAHPHPLRGGKQPRILFGTQATARPPTFVLFTTGFLEAGYRRFVERRLREEFGFVGTPIRINLRIREKRGARR
ncbi:MAG: ribosome biogenesis GTPase Der [Candidatus Nanopelagicales bacterium]